eukprot:9076769-Ditylum_brightwellii.AAC.1
MWCMAHCRCHIIPDGAGAEIRANRGPGTNRGAGIISDVGEGVTVRGGVVVSFDTGTLRGAVVMVGARIAASTLGTGTAMGVVVAFGMVRTFRGGRNIDS